MAPTGTTRSIPATACVAPHDFAIPVASIARSACARSAWVVMAPVLRAAGAALEGLSAEHVSEAREFPVADVAGGVSGCCFIVPPATRRVSRGDRQSGRRREIGGTEGDVEAVAPDDDARVSGDVHVHGDEVVLVADVALERPQVHVVV